MRSKCTNATRCATRCAMAELVYDDGPWVWSDVVPSKFVRTVVGNFVTVQWSPLNAVPNFRPGHNDQTCNCVPCLVYRVASYLQESSAIVHFHPNYGYEEWNGQRCCSESNRCPADDSLDVAFDDLHL